MFNHRRRYTAPSYWLRSSARRVVLTVIVSLLALSPTRIAAQTVGFFPPASLSSGSAIRSGVSDPVSNSLGHVAVGFGHSVWFAGDQLYGAAQVLVYGASLGNWFLPNPPTHPASAAYNELVSTRGSHLAAAGSYYWENLPNYLTLGIWSGAEAAYTDSSNFFNDRPYEGRLAYFAGGLLGGLATGHAVCAPLARGGTKGGRGAANAAAADAAGLDRPTQGASPGQPRGGAGAENGPSEGGLNGSRSGTLGPDGKPLVPPDVARMAADFSGYGKHPIYDFSTADPGTAYFVKWRPRENGEFGHAGIIIDGILYHLRVNEKGAARISIDGAFDVHGRIWKECPGLTTEAIDVLHEQVKKDVLAGEVRGVYESYSNVLNKLDEGIAVDKMSNCNSYAAYLFGLCLDAAKAR